ncbi:hypothetical protein EDB80DRAFT_875383 [Ilyonectria destructans]|nr:hypothetical protein EDB80DRAFT_875383 [Ilyonectria destructans]
MVNETSDLSGPGLNGGDLTLRDSHEPGRERKSNGTPLGEIEGGKAGEHLEGRKSAGQKDKSNSKEPNDVDHTAEWTETEENRDNTAEPRYEVEKIVDHRTKNRTEVELMVKWTGYSKPTLVDERTLQQDCPDALYHYWETRGTRERATGIRLEFHAFEVLKWKVEAEKLLFLVQWVGYPPKDATWEFAWRVKNFAEGMHAEYLRTHPAAKRAWEKENFRRVEKSAL